MSLAFEGWMSFGSVNSDLFTLKCHVGHTSRNFMPECNALEL
jgi:hypothetical protein